MEKTYDLVIVGAGSAGLTAANFAVKLGASVAIVEKGRVGGDCTWTGCVPSKTFLKAAKTAHEMRHADRHGLSPVEPEVDLRSVMAHVRDVISQVYENESVEVLTEQGIDVYQSEASFIDNHTIAAGDAQLRADKVLLATGARPFVPKVDGLDNVKFLTYEDVWELETLPKHLIIIGGGPIGCELAQAFVRLGSKVSIVEASNRILTSDDPEASGLLTDILQNEGIDIHIDSRLERVRMEGEEVHIAAGNEELAGDRLLLSLGRKPDLKNLSLENAEVNHDDSGIKVNDSLQTNQSHIYGAGDCIGDLQFTHYAGWQGFMAARNALLPGVSKGKKPLMPWATFTDPEIAHVGLTEAQAKENHGSVNISIWPMSRVDRSLIEGSAQGFIKLIYTSNGTPVGVTIVAEHASEMIHEWILAMEKGLKISDITSAIHIYPTYSIANMQMASDIRVSELLNGFSGRAIRTISRITR